LWPQELRTVHQLQQIGEQPRQLLVAVRRNAESLQLQALNPLGLELFRLNWGNGQLSSAGLPTVLESFDMAVLIADFQLVHWPLPLLQDAWRDSAWQVEQIGELRRLSCAGIAVSEVRYPPADKSATAIVLSNLLAGYTLEILNLDPQPASAAAQP
jgi:hypothetical protein